MMEEYGHDAKRRLVERYDAIMDEVRGAASACGRSPSDVTLIAVSKTHPADVIADLSEATGHRDFGESYVQEASVKIERLSGLGLNWHMIGHLQNNKAKYIVGKIALIHSLDCIKLADVINKIALQRRVRQKVLIQVNPGEESGKSGVREDGLTDLALNVADLPGLELTGLMLLPPFFDDPDRARPYFARLRELRDGLSARTGLKLPCLSMGMSGDFKAAIAEGATHVRVGTSIFGQRECRKKNL